ncbi:RM17 protein, partial [Amia calva]|nr:RM17 protein [Amia calva]
MRLSLPALISHGRVARRMGLGPESRINMLRNILTGLVRHERIETTWARADEVRVYAEKLIDCAKQGDTDEKAMRMASFWLTPGRYTNLYQIPPRQNLDRAKMAVLEYRGNPYPPLRTQHRDSDHTLLNTLLRGYREERQSQGGSSAN